MQTLAPCLPPHFSNAGYATDTISVALNQAKDKQLPRDETLWQRTELLVSGSWVRIHLPVDPLGSVVGHWHLQRTGLPNTGSWVHIRPLGMSLGIMSNSCFSHWDSNPASDVVIVGLLNISVILHLIPVLASRGGSRKFWCMMLLLSMKHSIHMCEMTRHTNLPH